MTDHETIVLRVPAGTKARWVHQSQGAGLKLSEWVLRIVGNPPADADRYLSRRFKVHEPGSAVLLTETQLRTALRKAYLAGAYRS